MNARYSRPIISIALSCWFGFLACLLGCAQPAIAATGCQQVQPNTGDRSPCCHHGRNRSGGQHENGPRAASCCPLDATLIQKQDPSSPLRGSPHAAVPVSLGLCFASQLVANVELPPSTIWCAGRDILLQTHVLRI